MNDEKKLIYSIVQWNIEKTEIQFLCYIDFSKLKKEYKDSAEIVAKKAEKGVTDYIYFSIVHISDHKIMWPDSCKSGLNIMMLDREKFNHMYNNRHLKMHVYYIGELPRATVRHLKRVLIGGFANLKAFFLIHKHRVKVAWAKAKEEALAEEMEADREKR